MEDISSSIKSVNFYINTKKTTGLCWRNISKDIWIPWEWKKSPFILLDKIKLYA